MSEIECRVMAAFHRAALVTATAVDLLLTELSKQHPGDKIDPEIIHCLKRSLELTRVAIIEAEALANPKIDSLGRQRDE